VLTRAKQRAAAAAAANLDIMQQQHLRFTLLPQVWLRGFLNGDYLPKRDVLALMATSGDVCVAVLAAMQMCTITMKVRCCLCAQVLICVSLFAGVSRLPAHCCGFTVRKNAGVWLVPIGPK
jgi:hypothetical protein